MPMASAIELSINKVENCEYSFIRDSNDDKGKKTMASEAKYCTKVMKNIQQKIKNYPKSI